jgi:hypothetical protein
MSEAYGIPKLRRQSNISLDSGIQNRELTWDPFMVASESYARHTYHLSRGLYKRKVHLV